MQEKIKKHNYIKNILNKNKIRILLVLILLMTSVFFVNKNILTSRQSGPAPKPRDTSAFKIGVNIAGVSDWSTQFPFLDVFKMSREWVTQCDDTSIENTTTKCGWSTEEQAKLNLDANGYPKTLPLASDRKSVYRVVGTPLLTVEKQDLTCSRFVVKYDGEGELDYSFVNKDVAASKSGRDVFDIPSDYPSIAIIKIVKTDINKNGNYVKNIRVVCENQEDLLDSGKAFNPIWTDKFGSFDQFRFMDWMNTNNSEQKEWENRPKVNDRSWAIKGVPVEIMVKLANELNLDPYFNMPYLSTPEYQKEFAKYVRDNLNSNLIASVEFSNETWNWQFVQAQDSNVDGRNILAIDVDKNGKINKEESDAAPGDSYVQYAGYKTWQMCKNWREIYGTKSKQMECGIGSQTAWRGMENSVTECPDIVALGLTNGRPCSDGADFFFTAGYFSGYMQSDESIPVIKSWLANPDPEFAFKQALKQLKDSSLIAANGDGVKQTIESMKFYVDFAKTKGLKTKVYEGGTHLTANGLGSQDDQQIVDFFVAVNKRPEMYDLYIELMQGAKDAGVDTFNHFADIGRPGKYGSWGILDSLNVTTKNAHRYCALINFQTGKNNCVNSN